MSRGSEPSAVDGWPHLPFRWAAFGRQRLERPDLSITDDCLDHRITLVDRSPLACRELRSRDLSIYVARKSVPSRSMGERGRNSAGRILEEIHGAVRLRV